MLIPVLTAKGKTKLCLKKYGLDETKILGTYSNNGWVNCGIMKIILEKIYETTKGQKSVIILLIFVLWVNCGIMKIILEKIYETTKGQKSVILLDQYKSHCDEFIKEEAKKKNIKLLYVPKGLTYKYQPLDVLINGILKQKAKKLWRQEIVKDPNIKIKNSDAVKHFLKSKDDITSDIIKKSFNESCFL
jgi:hypothetical protein